ncbi:MAG: type II secretion system protein M [Gammaproteobacteria bacterium]|nr:type II secretion system protein M [Gammaproteobacteria bacterium]
MKQLLTEKWAALTDRDRKALLLLVPAIIVYGVLTAFLNVSNEAARIEQRNQILSQQFEEMQMVLAGRSAVGPDRTQNLTVLVNQIGDRSNLSYDGIQPSANGVRVTVRDAEQKQLWRWLAFAQSEGLNLASFTLTANEDGTVDLNATVVQ